MEFWIARDKYGLWLLETKPYIDNDMFTCDGNVYRIDSDLFPEVTFENSPKRIELKLMEKNNGIRNFTIIDTIEQLSCNHVIGVADNQMLIYKDELQNPSALDKKFNTVDRFSWQPFVYCPRCGAKVEWVKKRNNMKRLDEIRYKAETLYDTKNLGGSEAIKYCNGARDGFIFGANWADTNPNIELIKKICNIVIEHKPNKDMSDFEMYQFCAFVKSKLYENK